MKKFSHFTLIVFSGSLWIAMAVALLTLATHFMQKATLSHMHSSTPLLQLLFPLTHNLRLTASLIFAFSMSIGYLKGSFVLKKSVNRIINRIKTLPNPTPLHTVYPVSYYFIILCMMSFGMIMKYTNLPLDIRAAVDAAIGIALLKGGLSYFHIAFKNQKELL